MADSHRIFRFVHIEYFLGMINSKNIVLTDHVFFHLKQVDRKIFKDAIISNFIRQAMPLSVGLQSNGCYAVFYYYDKRQVLKIVVDVQPREIIVVTFFVMDKFRMPK